ncbi:MAG: Ig-like domain-containing protein [Bacteroidota bacterium]
MNIFQQIKLFLLTLVLGFPLLSFSQATNVSGNIFQGETFSNYIVLSEILPAAITEEPSNGVAYWEGQEGLQGVAGINKLSYRPNDGFVGEDTFVVTYFQGMLVPYELTVVVNVRESVVLANDDYTDTNLATPISVAVLANDENTNGNLSIRDVLVSSGAEEVSVNIDGTITFTPQADFTGIAYFEYLVCNDADVCDNATVSISVHNTASPENETHQIFTKKNTPQAILFPLEGYELETAPEKGFIDNSEDVWYYIPNEDEYGVDQFIYRSGNVTTTVNVEIINAEADNLYAIDDYAYTPIDQAVEINFLENDVDSDDFSTIVILDQPLYGTISQAQGGNGVVTYQPNLGFSTVYYNPGSVDRFTYRITLANGTEEVATVYIYVNDFDPSASTFELSVAKNSPLAIQYAVPINYHSFEVVSQGDLGEVKFFQEIDEPVLGQRVVGEKVLLYVPNNQAIGYDEFEVQYCVSPDADCKSVKIKVNILDIEIPEEEKCVLANCVWEGDTNNDGVVNMQDLLSLGHVVGETGATRDRSDSDKWYGRSSNDWGASNGRANLKHSDTDGNGIVNGKDVDAIDANFGRKHSITSTPLPSTDYLPISTGQLDTIPLIGSGSTVEIPIILGFENYPMTDIYGLSFDISYSTSFFREGTVDIIFEENSWFTYNSSTLSLSKEAVTGRLDAGMTRTNSKTISGHGQIARISGTTVIDLDGYRLGDETPTGVITISATATNSAGEQVNLGTDTYTFQLDLSKAEETASEEFAPADAEVSVFPNPTTEVLNISDNVERLEIFTLTGQQVYTAQNEYSVKVKNWSEGVYILRAYTMNGNVVNKKFEVVK